MANSLTGVLGGYLEGQRTDREQQMGQLQQFGTLQGILSQAQKQQMLRQEDLRQQEYRGALSRATTDEERMAAAANALGPEGLMKHFDTRAKTENTKQIAMNNLQQKIATEMRHAYEFAQTLPLRQRETALKEIQANATNLWHAGSLAIQKGNLDYNVGSNTSGIGDIISRLRSTSTTAPATDAAPTGGVDFNFGGVRGTVPDEASALALGRSMGFGGGSAPAAPPAAPMAAPEQPAPIPAAPNNLDARDLGAMSRGPVMGSIPGTAPVAPQPAASAPQMPQFSGSPRQVADSQNRWKLAQQNIVDAAARAKAVAQARAEVKGTGQGRPLPAKAAEDIVGRESIIGLIDNLISQQEKAMRAGKGYGGYGFDGLGNVALKAGRALGENPEEVNFFSALETIAQPDRHSLFGATLTGNELNSWRTGWVGTGDNPQTLLNVMKQKRAMYKQMMDSKTNSYKRLGFQTGGNQPATTEDSDRVTSESLGTGTAGEWNDSKEKRYQELLRKRGS